MKCRIARQKIRLLIGNDLSQNEVLPVQEHIARCASCGQHVEDLLDSSDILTTFGAESSPQRQTSVWESVAGQLPAKPESGMPEQNRRLRKSILVVATVMTIIALGILPDLFSNASFRAPPGIQVTHPASIELPAGEYVRQYSDQSWESLEVLDTTVRRNTHGPVRNVVGF